MRKILFFLLSSLIVSCPAVAKEGADALLSPVDSKDKIQSFTQCDSPFDSGIEAGWKDFYFSAGENGAEFFMKIKAYPNAAALEVGCKKSALFFSALGAPVAGASGTSVYASGKHAVMVQAGLCIFYLGSRGEKMTNDSTVFKQTLTTITSLIIEAQKPGFKFKEKNPA
ncbi:hypothetical protein DB346_05625 [Verrucomicrobia bacterium LW23]|nr:hypothetical protein DB346_05625 [Verrucomicrobia bacterium LW23]